MSVEAAVSLAPGRPLAPMQRALWMSQRLHPAAPVQNMALLTHIDGPIDPERLAAAFDEVVAQVDVLRTRIIDYRGTPVIRLNAEPQAPSILPLQRAEAEQWAAGRVAEPIDSAVRGYDSAILAHPDGTVSWYLALHHTITDATSSAMVFAATAAAYDRQPVDAGSYYAWARQFQPTPPSDSKQSPRSKRRSQATEFWRRRAPAQQIDRLYRPIRTPVPEADRMPVPVDGRLVHLIERQLAEEYRMLSPDLAWSALLMTVTASYLHQVAGADDFSLGLPVHNRSDAEARGLIGPIMEVFPVDVSIRHGQTFRALHKEVSRSILRTLGQAVPGTAPTPDYAAVVNVIPRGAVGSFGSIPTTTRWIHSGAIDSNHLLRVQLSAYDDPESSGRPALALDLNHGGADPDHRRWAPTHFHRLLEAMVSDPDQPIIQSLPQGDELAAISAWESTADFDTPIPDVVSQLRAALRNRQTVALTEDERSWTGQELWDQVELTAHWLRRRGVTSSDRVGIELPRSAEAVIAILAVLTAGGSFVPLDVAHPEKRRRSLTERAGCRLVLSSLPELEDHPVELIEVGLGSVDLDQEAYLLFTSGSSGQPKGVPITHRGLARYFRFAVESYVGDGPAPVVPLFSSLNFDLTITSLFLPLLTGGEQVVIRADGPNGLAAIAGEPRLNWCKATPSHLEVLVRLLPADHGLRTVVVGGEAFGSGLAQRLLELRHDLAIFNEYGPTEAVVGCMIHRVDPDHVDDHQEIPIGVPAPGVTLRVVGPGLERAPLGTAGELCISHVGVTDGYLPDPSETDPSGTDPFIQLADEVSGHKRFYRSGDLVRLMDAETLVYLGRIDEQVKVGGIRLEPTEVEDALTAHPAVAGAAVRLWSPTFHEPEQRCVTCGLPSNVPIVSYDEHGVCSTCRDYERVAPQTTDWFRTVDDLRAKRNEARARRTGRYDCLHLLSGGKDSTYALYQLVEAGFEPYAFTLDNGFISEEAKENVRRTVAELGIDHELATSEAMNAIFRDSLDRHSNVCQGCYKTIYTLATTRAVELGIPMIVTGLSRGQLFETRLIPQQFAPGRFDPDAIDRAVIEARKTYHRLDDAPNRLLDTGVFAADEVFDQIEYLDFYRYVDVELAELLRYLDANAPWVRPSDTGRSTNCLINAAGIHTHKAEQGYHNYAIPYAWDVRLGHKTRDEAIDELDDQLDAVEVDEMLRAVGYVPKPPEILTAWLEPMNGTAPSPAELRTFLAGALPSHAIPTAFVTVDELPLTTNGKLDTGALPAPERFHRSSTGIQVAPESELEATIIKIWERLLRAEPIGAEDDFFAMGGDSLGALEMIVAVGDAIGRALDDSLAFGHSTPRALAAAIETVDHESLGGVAAPTGPPAVPTASRLWSDDEPPPLSPGELAILFEQSASPGSLLYNVGRLYRIGGVVDLAAISDALRKLAAEHVPLSWTYGRPRRRLAPEDAVAIDIGTDLMPVGGLEEAVRLFHRVPFDLNGGPLLRAWLRTLDDGTTAVLLVCHHVSGDAESFDRLWARLDGELQGRTVEAPTIDYPTFTTWQQAQLTAADSEHWRLDPSTPPAATAAVEPASTDTDDGFVTLVATVTPAQLQRKAGASGFALATAAVTATLRRYSDGDRIPLGLIASSRNHPLAEPLFGYFLNTLPLELTCSPIEPLDALTDRASGAIATNLAHRAYPYSRIVAERREAGFPPPSTQILLAYDELGTTSLLGLPVEQRVLSNGSAVTDATFFVELRDDHVDLSIEHRGLVIDHHRAQQLLRDVDIMLSAVVTQPATTIGDVELPSTPASRLVGPALDAPPDLLQLIDDNATGAEPAVICGSRTLSRGELDQLSAALAGRLQLAGVGGGDRVVVNMARSVELAVAIVAVLRTGAAYVPVDPSYPRDRVELIISAADAAATLLGTGSGTESTGDIPTLVVDLDSLAAESARPIDVVVSGDDIAYVIFTSGSTGQPRGVPVSHRRLAASTMARAGVYERPVERFLVISSPAFDSSITGLFWALAGAGTIVLPTDREVHDPDEIVGLFERHDVTHTLMVPTLYQSLLERAPATAPWPAHVIVAGEACSPALVATHFERRPQSALTNEYGPTEATVWATAHHCRPGDDSTPIGKPIPGTWVAVGDRTGALRPAGVAGELLIGGQGVVDGYFDDEAATELCFGESEHGRFFCTGDRVVIRDGLVHFLGRVDSQLNVGGVRAEPADIERVLTTDPAVAAAVVTAIDPRPLHDLVESADPIVLGLAMREAAESSDPAAHLIRTLRTDHGARLRLVAFLEPLGDSADIDLDQLRERVSSKLPPLLRPSSFFVTQALPRTPNGKIDRDGAVALPTEALAPEPVLVPVLSSVAEASGGHNTADDLDRRIAGLFAEVLRRPSIAVDQSFFDAGGHSLLAMELLLRLEQQLQVDLTVSTLYDHPTPQRVASVIRGLGTDLVQNRFLVPIQPNGTKVPIFGIHVLGPNAEFYRPLAERLGPDQPIWGLGLPTRTPDTSGPTDVTEVATRYADELAGCAPDGPITLAAVSLGSVVAFELAHQLRARGREVALLALFDAVGPSIEALSARERLVVHGRELGRDPRHYVAHRSRRLRSRLERQGEIASLRVRNALGLPVPDELKIRAFVEANWAAQGTYEFEPYPGRLVVYKAGDDPFTELLAKKGMGWFDVAKGPFKVTVVPGEHLSMLAEPHVAALATTLGADHAEATGGPRSRAEVEATGSPRSRAEVEAALVEALGQGTVGIAVARLVEQADSFEPDAVSLVRRCDRATIALAEQAEKHGQLALQALTEAGVAARLETVPSRLAHCSFALSLINGDRRPNRDELPRVLGDAIDALARWGYRPQQRIDRAALIARSSGEVSCPFIHDEATVRVDLRWGSDPTRGGLRDRSMATDSGRGQPDLGIFLGTPSSLISDILEVAQPTEDDVLVDLGCGDGRVLIEAARRFGCRGRGVENDPRLVAEARMKVDEAGLDGLIEIVEADASTTDLSDVSVVFTFLPANVVASLLPGVLARLGPGARMVAHEQLRVEWPVEPTRSQLIVADHLTVVHLWTSPA